MSNKIKTSLSVKIVGISGILVALVLASLIIITTKISNSNVLISEQHNLQQISETIGELIDLRIDSLMENLKLQSENEFLIFHIGSENINELNLFMKNEYEKSGLFDSIILTNRVGDIIVNYPSSELLGEKFSDINEYTNISKSIVAKPEQVFLDDKAHFSKVSGQPVFSITSAVINDGKLLGTLTLLIDLSKLYEKYLRNKTFGVSGYGYIGDNFGRLIAHTKPELNLADYKNADFMTGALEGIARGENQGIVKYKFEGRQKYMVYYALETTDWHVAMSVYEEDLTELSTTLSKVMITIGVGALIILITLLIIMTIIFVSKPIGKVTVELTNGSNNLESASMQIASSSQELSSGNSELAASIEEITSSLEELQSVIELNTKNINESELLMKETNENSQKVSGDISNLSEALTEIGDNSEEIVNIVKVIEDIAFQTNILALNAAVEAGRAGEAGSGFAVVADQVKDLAQKSSESSKETAKLIKTAIDSITRGQEIGRTVKVAQDKASEMSNNVTILLNEVNRASKEQMKGVNQITQAITQTNSVVQQTAASAEETSSASEELLGQSVSLNEVVDSLNIIIKGKKMERESYSIEKKSQDSSNTKKALPLKSKTSEKFDPNDIIPMNDEFKEF